MRLATTLICAALAGCMEPSTATSASAPTAIAEVQGKGPSSLLVGRKLAVEGVVGEDFAGLGGVFIESATPDDSPATAEGLFVPRAKNADPVLQAGDRVRIVGTVSEIGKGDSTLTAIEPESVEKLGTGQPRTTRLEEAPAAGWESLEGMRVRIDVPLTVNGVDALERYGELVLAFGGRLYTPTEVARPGPPARELAFENARRQVRVDDGQVEANTDLAWYLAAAPTDAAPLRVGSTVTGVEGVVDERFGSHRLQMAEPFGPIVQAPRPPPPTVRGDRRIAGFNVLNLFNGDGDGGGFPTDRGAKSRQEYERQQAKLVAVVQALDPDLAALMELENDGYGPMSSLAQFVAALNAAGPHDDWRFVAMADGPGTNPIRVGIIYRAERFAVVGEPATITEGAFADRSRAPLAQAFRAGDGPVFVVAANHFKSKGCGEDAVLRNADRGDGQACFNGTRVDSARMLHAWLAADPTRTGPVGTLVIGDLNAYAEEDPLRLLRSRGWQDAFAPGGEARPYSFVYAGQSGRLDHALLDAGLAARLRGAVEWHNNADESELFDYRRDLDGDPWRASDHDPMLLGLDLAR